MSRVQDVVETRPTPANPRGKSALPATFFSSLPLSRQASENYTWGCAPLSQTKKEVQDVASKMGHLVEVVRPNRVTDSPLFNQAPARPKHLPPPPENWESLTPADISTLCFKVETLMQQWDELQSAVNNAQMEKEQQERMALHQERMKETARERDVQKTALNWSTATYVFSFLTIFVGIGGGIATIMAGNPVAGTLLVAGGVLQLTNQVMQMTGGWDKVGELLPGDDLEGKKRTLAWMQISVGVVAIILMGSGGVIGGQTVFSEAMQTANMLTGAALLAAIGICSVGEGISKKKVKDCAAKFTEIEGKLTAYEFTWKDLMSHQEEIFARMKRGAEFISILFDMRLEISKRIGELMRGSR